jgi:tRNA U34 5-methylaminomethyl-2-thiouridine-forming methyltransferase MnmC
MHNTTTITSSLDGVQTIKTDKFDTYYHSINGPYNESDVVFIASALEYFVSNNPSKDNITIFEMGFGTGLNVLKTYIWVQNKSIKIDFHTIEAYPFDESIVKKLNYGKDLGAQDFFDKMHSCPWNEYNQFSENFRLIKYNCLIEDFKLPEGIDIVYYDAFAPKDQPELWKAPILEKYYAAMNDGAVLTTYCSQGEFRRQLISCGFKVERIPGPNGKREMIRAQK